MSTQTVALNHYTQGPPDGPAVLLGGSLGTSLALWDDLAEHLAPTYHVVRFDLRGHGSTPVPPGPYTMGELAGDVVALADDLGLDRFAYVGLSFGGAIGLTLALEHPERLTSLVLCGTAPAFGEPETWRERSSRVANEGMGWLVETTRDRWFTRGFQESHPVAVNRVMEMLATTSPVGYAACCDALAGFDVSGRLGEVTVPTRVVAANQDPVTPPDVTRLLADGIRDADLVVVDHAAHIANVAQPEEFARAVSGHLDRTAGA